ncbi:type IV secretory system conjugative DNA transfer family protein [Roseateles sp. DC23W]|uniref:Type IV secretory system conjugative DNA transfer family protein n=1 Tax=Pelomonas dachongensis TaxID=3299029 RepID=A0ABW7EFP7_9BURK
MVLWSTQRKVAALILAFCAYVALLLVAMYLAGVLFLLLNLVSPSPAGVFSIAEYWMAYADDEGLRTRLEVAIAAAAGGLLIVLRVVLFVRVRPLRYLLGDARFACAAEVRRSGLLACTPASILLGRYRDRYLSLSGQGSVLLAAPARSCAASSVVIPNLLSWPHSVVVVDVDGGGYRATAGFRAKFASEVYAFAPFDADARSHRWNPLSVVRRSGNDRVTDLLRIGCLLYPDRDNASTRTARNLFVVLGLLLSESPESPFTMGEMLRLASGYGDSLTSHIRNLIRQRREEGRPLSDECTQALACVLEISEPALAGIVAAFRAPLLVFADPVVDAATSESDFRLDALRRRRMSVYVHLPKERLAGATPLLNLFFGQLIELNTAVRPEADATLKYQCLLICDAFSSMGRMSSITSAAPDLGEFNLRLLTVVRTVSDLGVIYGSNQAEVFARHHSLQIFFAPRQQDEAHGYSAMLADRCRMSAPRHSGFGLGRLLVSRQLRETPWPFLMPHELKELGSDCAIVSLTGYRPILARRIRFDQELAFRERVLAPPVVPQLDVVLHQALVHKRRCEIGERRQADEAASVMAFAHDLSSFSRTRNFRADPLGHSLPDPAGVGSEPDDGRSH